MLKQLSLKQSIIIFLIVSHFSCSSVLAEFKWKWVYAPCNYADSQKVNDLLSVISQAKSNGYNGIVTSDVKWGNLKNRSFTYYENLNRTKKFADKCDIELIPGVVDIGYSESILKNNPNLAEGLHVKDAVLSVESGLAVIDQSENHIKNGGLDVFKGNYPLHWDKVDKPGKLVFKDDLVKFAGSASLRMENFSKFGHYGMARIKKKVKLTPWHQYKISVNIKTQDVANSEKIKVTVLGDGGKALNYSKFDVKPTQNWEKYEIIFNTLENTYVDIWIGIWGGKSGRIWFDDISVCEALGVNLLRRSGCPVKLTSIDGKFTYKEGVDFKKWENPYLGNNRWKGDFFVSHDSVPITIIPNSKIKEGQKVKVSYYHTLVIFSKQVTCCLSSEEVFKYIEEQVQQIDRFLSPEKYFMNYDEIRIAGQCGLCRSKGKTAGQLLADHVSRSIAIIKKVNPEAEIFVWSDMFDPFGNARDDYYLSASTFRGSWKGLDSSVRIVNWNAAKGPKSLAFFSSRGHQQVIAGYYDNSDFQSRLVKWFRPNKKPSDYRAEGIMYTTWKKNYKDMKMYMDSSEKLNN